MMILAVVLLLLILSGVAYLLYCWAVFCRSADDMTAESPPTNSLDDGLKSWASQGDTDPYIQTR